MQTDIKHTDVIPNVSNAGSIEFKISFKYKSFIQHSTECQAVSLFWSINLYLCSKHR